VVGLKINRLGSKEKNCRKLTNNALGLLEMAILLAGAMVILCTGALAVLFTSTLAEENTTDYWLMKGYEQSKNGSNDMALLAYERAIQIDPDNSLAWINKANALYRLNRTPESENAYRMALNITDKMLEADSDNSTLWLGRGVLLNNIGKAKEAVEAFDRASNIDPGNEMAWKMKGVLLASDLKEYDKALAAFDRALQINPNDAVIWKLKGDALAASGRKSESDQSSEEWYQKGQELARIGSWENAIDAYDQAVRLNPDYKEAWCAKCQAMSNENLLRSVDGGNVSFDEAINACDQALAIDSNDSRSWSSKGFVLYHDAMVGADPSKYNDSLLAYENAIKIAGSDRSALALAWRGKGTVLCQMKEYEESLAAQEKAIELNGSDVEAWMGKAIALSRLSRNDEAVASFDRILEIYSNEEQRIFDYPYLWYSKGRALDKLGRSDEASHAYNESIEDADTIIGWVASGRDFYMNLSETWKWKAELLEEMGRHNESLLALENEREPENLG